MRISEINQWVEIGKEDYRGGCYALSIWAKVDSIDTKNNRSQIETELRMSKTKAIAQSSEVVASSSYQTLEIGNSTASDNTGFDFSDKEVNESIVLLSNIIWINHTADGSKSINIGAEHTTGTSLGNLLINTEIELPTIPRISDFTLSKDSVVMSGEESISVYINRASELYTHKIVFECGHFKSEFLDIDDYKSFIVPKDWNNAVVNSEKSKAHVTVTTYEGTRQIGNSKTKNFVVKVPDDIVPSIGSFTAERIALNSTVEEWGMYLQSFTRAKLDIQNASGSYGSTITYYKISGEDFVVPAKSAISGLFYKYGTFEFEALVVDSRGRSQTKTLQIDVEYYNFPIIFSQTVCTRADANRYVDPTGENILVIPNVRFSSVGGRNSAVIKVNGEEIDEYTLIENVPLDESFEVIVSIEDTFHKLERKFLVPTALFPIDFHSSGTGTAIGKVSSEAELFDIGIDTKIDGELKVGKDINDTYMIMSSESNGAIIKNSNTGKTLKLCNDSLLEYDGYLVYHSGNLDLSNNLKTEGGKISGMVYANYYDGRAMFGGNWSSIGNGWAIGDTGETNHGIKIGQIENAVSQEWVDGDVDIYLGSNAYRVYHEGYHPRYKSLNGTVSEIPGGIYGEGINYIKNKTTSLEVRSDTNVVYGVDMWKSDKSLKKNIEPTKLKSASEIIKKLEHISFDWKEDDGHVDIGYIADELEKIYPQLVYKVEQKDKTELRQVDKRVLIPIITMSMQEIMEENCRLKTSLKNLEKELKDEIEKIKVEMRNDRN